MEAIFNFIVRNPQAVALVPSVLVALMALNTFRRNNRIKAAEILLKIEDEYKVHVQTFFEVEYSPSYMRKYYPALQMPTSLSDEGIEALTQLEKALQFLYVCESVRRLGIDNGAIDRLCQYHIGILAGNNEDRRDLKEYVKKYWPSIWNWNQSRSYSLPKRIFYMSCRKLIHRSPSTSPKLT
ncbi:MAG: hypothetical protein KDD67_12625 [Ignavibacteriae bacterium]|nr:hypothetical protein [Ignavibacteriota bacterium]MCB9214319.1 hypothetical protein [Ignavibacteria bacterium]